MGLSHNSLLLGLRSRSNPMPSKTASRSFFSNAVRRDGPEKKGTSGIFDSILGKTGSTTPNDPAAPAQGAPKPQPQPSATATGLGIGKSVMNSVESAVGKTLGSGDATASQGTPKPQGGGTATEKLPRGFTLLRRHPFLAVSSLVITHVGIAWLLVPPTYFVMHNLTPGGATSMLAGPTTAWALSQSVPRAMQGTIPGFRGWATENLKGRDPTFEDVLEYFARRASKIAWRGARSTMSLVNKARAADMAKREAAEEEEVADEAVKTLVKGTSDGAPVARKAMDRLGFSRRAQDVASEIRFAQVRDAVAAYIFVKTILPLRIPLSLFLAPKLARTFLTMFRR